MNSASGTISDCDSRWRSLRQWRCDRYRSLRTPPGPPSTWSIRKVWTSAAISIEHWTG